MKPKLLLLLILLISSYSFSQFPTTDLTSLYEFTDGSLVDGASAVNFTASRTTSLIKVEDRFGNTDNAVSLNGSFLNRANIDYTSTYEDISVAFWFKTTDNTSTTTIIKERTTKGYEISLKNGKISVYTAYSLGSTSKAKTLNSNKVIADGEWHHIVVATEQYATSIHIDGVSDNVAALDSPAPRFYLNRYFDVDTSVLIGGNATEYIDDLFFYNRKITAAEITQLSTSNNFCYAPNNTIVLTNTITETSANIYIGQTGTFDIAYHKTSEPFSNAVIINDVTTASGDYDTAISGLSEATSYSVYIREQCNNLSAWSEEKKFITDRPAGTTRLYVSPSATGNNNGLTWADAYITIEDALETSQANDEIWISSGIYHPHTSDRDVYYQINKEGLKLYGGFAGTETQLTQRVVGTNETILSGDLNNDDVNVTDYATNYANATRNTDNSYHIINITSAGNNLVLDGLTISDAHNNLSDSESGGAIVKEKTIANLSVKNCVIKDNVSRNANAGIFAEFELNNGFGTAGVFIVENSQFLNNMSRHGTTIYSYLRNHTKVDMTIANTLFDGNLAGDLSASVLGYAGSGSWLRNLGNASSQLNIALTNNTYVSNVDTGTSQSLNNFTRATIGLTKSTGAGTTTADVSNCIFWNNTTVGGATARSITDLYESPLNTITITNSIDELNFNDDSITTKTNTSNSDPLFTDLANNDYTLTATSPALDAGDNTNTEGPTDLLGNNRIFNTTVDMGVYEYGASLPVYRTLTTSATNGVVTKDVQEANGAYVDGDIVVLTATPNTGYQFDSWTGDASGTTNPLSVSLDTDKSIEAVFTIIQQTLTTTSTNGTITADVQPTNGTYDYGTVVELTATPDTGFLFSHWTGDTTETTSTITLTMDSAKTVEAVFECGVNIPDVNFKNALLSGTATRDTVDRSAVNIDTNNDLEISCAEAAAFTGFITIDYKEIADLTGIEAFTNLFGLQCGNNDLKEVDLSNNLKLEILEIQNNDLTDLDVSSNTSLGVVYCANNKLTSLNVANGLNLSTQINIRYGPTYYGFSTYFSGNPDLTCIQVSDVNYANTNLSSRKNATASFSEDCNAIVQQTLTTTNINGTVIADITPTDGTYDYGTVVELTATPDTGYQFDGWSGDATGTTNPLTITMDADKTVTATFSRIQHTLITDAVNGSITVGSALKNIGGEEEVKASKTSNDIPKFDEAINLGTNNGQTYNFGIEVILTATPDAGYQFDGWSGDATGTTNPLTITMDADKNVTAMFSVDDDLSVRNNTIDGLKINIENQTIKTNLKNITINVYSLLGEEVDNQYLNGLYIVLLKDDKGNNQIEKVLITE